MDHYPDEIPLSVKSLSLLRLLFKENQRLSDIIHGSNDEEAAKQKIKEWALEVLNENTAAVSYYERKDAGHRAFDKLRWKDFAAIRILDYLSHAGRDFKNPYRGKEKTITDPFGHIWIGAKSGGGGTKPLFFKDMIYLFRQLNGKLQKSQPKRETVLKWMKRWHHGLEPVIVKMREENKERIIRILVEKIESCDPVDAKYFFKEGLGTDAKIQQVREWWNDYMFHLRFAVRSPGLLNELLDYSLDPDTQKLLKKAEKKGIPFFANPYYLTLLSTRTEDFAAGADLAIRHYVIYSKPLVEQFGEIVAWEKEDRIEKGKPNAAGWMLPSSRNVHRRYPEVAIMIPDTMGRACAGLCASCQRMYDFQRGNLSFSLEKLKPREKWDDKLQRLLDYFENDTQLRDILITGGDALMSQDKSLEKILNEVCEMAKRKREANKNRPDGEKYAEIFRIRLGTRLLAYLPQRVTPNLSKILSEFKQKASMIGVKQFVIQTHFESPMEVTSEAKIAVERLISAGWIVTNQLVFTTAASRRGHTAMLRKVLNDIGVISYYTFSVKGFYENTFNYATNARAVQEQLEEKVIGKIPHDYEEKIIKLSYEPERLIENLKSIRVRAGIPFLATDRNMINLPAVGKSMTFRTIGITRWGRRILEFGYDPNRWHSPIIKELGKLVIIESKPIGAYLQQLKDIGENAEEYESIWGYSIGETEPRPPIFDYPSYDFKITDKLTNLEI